MLHQVGSYHQTKEHSNQDITLHLKVHHLFPLVAFYDHDAFELLWFLKHHFLHIGRGNPVRELNYETFSPDIEPFGFSDFFPCVFSFLFLTDDLNHG